MNLKEVPFYNRPWTKIRREGPKNLNDAELFAVIFGRGNKFFNAVDLSNKLLGKFNLNKLQNASFLELFEVLNDEIKVYQVMALCELNIRYSKLRKNGFSKKIFCAKDVFNILCDELKNKKKEFLYVLLLDAKNTVLSKEIISIGTLTSSLIHPREVFNLAIRESANSIIVVHNHPSGDVSPSDADLSICKRLIECGDLLGIKLLDFIIVGNSGFWSYVENI